MKTIAALALAILIACVGIFTTAVSADDDPPPGAGVQVGDRCYKGDVPPRQGLICLPAFVEIAGQTREEWEYESSYLLNGRKGDSVLSAGCGLIANLLRKVNPEQQYSHAGLMVEDRHRIRHSTASVDWIMEHKAGSPPGTEGLIENALKFAWPGTITQWADEAFEGAFVQAPSGDYFEMQSFNPSPVLCGLGGQLTPDTVLKPLPVVEALDPEVRARVAAAADAGLAIDGHYRFFGYSQPADVLFTPVGVPGDWSDGTVGSVCSAFVWRSMKDAGFTLEGSTIEADDVEWRGAQMDSQTADGLYLYTVAERSTAAQFIYDELGEMVSKNVTGFEDFLVDVSDDLGNQVVNCFGFDWCGETFSPPAEAHGCDPGDERAQDSPCWLNEGPGVGRAVSPDNMLNWDAAPNGPYGYREDAHYAVGGYHRVYRWRADVGTGTLQGAVADNGTAQPYIPVVLDGVDIVAFTDGAGDYTMEAVPDGNATVRTCTGNRGKAAIVLVTAGQTTTQDLALQNGCNQAPDPGKWRRKVRIHGTVKIHDTEDIGSDEIQTWQLDETVIVEPNTPSNPETAVQVVEWTRCTGGEVRAKLELTVRLDQHDRSVEVTTVARMFEGQSCNDDDLDGTKTKLHVVPEDGSKSFAMVINNEEFTGEDKISINLVINNQIAPQ